MSPGRFLVSSLLFAAAVAVAAPPLDLPECVRHAAFAGITQTDPDGNVIGTPDPGDWNCDSGLLRDVPSPPPPQLCLWPAFPNPATFGVKLRFGLPQPPTDVSLVIYGQHGKRGRAFPVRTLVSGPHAAGIYEVTWDLTDDAGVRLAPDIYRAVLVVDGKELFGDIEVH